MGTRVWNLVHPYPTLKMLTTLFRPRRLPFRNRGAQATGSSLTIKSIWTRNRFLFRSPSRSRHSRSIGISNRTAEIVSFQADRKYHAVCPTFPVVSRTGRTENDKAQGSGFECPDRISDISEIGLLSRGYAWLVFSLRTFSLGFYNPLAAPFPIRPHSDRSYGER